MTTPAHPAGFSELIHAPTRLSLVSLLSATRWIEFGRLRDTLALTDSALSKQVTTLERAGFVAVHRNGIGRGKRMHVRLTPEGRSAFLAHVAALQAIVERANDDPDAAADPDADLPEIPPLDTGRPTHGRRLP